MPLLFRPGLGGPRLGRPGLLGTAARTAVIAGTAAAVGGGVRRRAGQRDAERAEAEAYEQGSGGPSVLAPLSPPPPASPDRVIAQLRDLAALRDQGVLTSEEFAQQKAAILH